MPGPPKSSIPGAATNLSAPPDIRAALGQGIRQLRDAGVRSYTLAAELLLLHAIGRERTWIYSHPEEPLTESQAEHYFALLARRASGEPVQHLTGHQEFWGLEFEVTPDVLIPRPETEHLIEVALDRLAVREIRAGRQPTLSGAGLEVADIGTGSGCIAIALAKELPGAHFLATDISAAALDVAKRNARRHDVQEYIEFSIRNLLAGVAPPGRELTAAGETLWRRTSPDIPRFDLIVSNPPYIGRNERETLEREVRDHEPELALYGGEQGWELYADLIAAAARHLKPRGLLVLELGHNSLPAVEALLDAPQWTATTVSSDLAGIARVIAAERTLEACHVEE
jgi:release factor glutamine methyltransferase